MTSSAARLLRLSALMMITCVAGCRSGGKPARDPDAAAKLIDQARSLAGRGDYGGALDALGRAKQLDPDRVAIYALRAQLLEQSSHFREARDEALVAHRLAPNDPTITMGLLDLDVQFIRPGETEALARLAAQQVPQSEQPHLWLGRIIAHEGNPKRYPEAIAEFHTANQLAPQSPEPLTEMGDLYACMGDYETAAALLEGAAKRLDEAARHPGMPFTVLQDWIDQRRMSSFLLSKCYIKLHRPAESRRAAQTAALWSERGSELRHVGSRAAANPPDQAARNRLLEIRTKGLAAWPAPGPGPR